MGEIVLNTGDTAWVLASTALVLLMTPGLALFYGGMVRAKSVLNMMLMSMVTIGIVSVLWVIYGFKLAFGYEANSQWYGSISLSGLGSAVNELTNNGGVYPIPLLAFAAFQLMFAIITPALISGAIVDRMKFSSYVIFIAMWSLLVYAPLAHFVWGEGGLFVGKALDFAGGTVVHISSGFSALALALLLGKRKLAHNEDSRPHNLPMTLIGTGLLWFGWFGFNAGSSLAANGLAASALVTTHLAAATAGLIWLSIEWVTVKKPTALGFASGAVAGLVAITPGAGFVTPLAAIAIGAVVPFVSYGMIKLKSKFGYDDTLDVFAVHGCGGLWGAIATGIFANKAVNSAGFNGLIHGNPGLLTGQITSALVAAGLGFLGTTVIYYAIKIATKTLRVTPQDEEAGLDVTQHGETAYVTEN